ncbi:hypothetical protein [Candidatus Spongiihabitans sp.]|uniref:hypothetical protein n=1 Tax=Candidatus Spongiihabitans sp. TaxID=3101308 RepID=UPI003C6ED0A0
MSANRSSGFLSPALAAAQNNTKPMAGGDRFVVELLAKGMHSQNYLGRALDVE